MQSNTDFKVLLEDSKNLQEFKSKLNQLYKIKWGLTLVILIVIAYGIMYYHIYNKQPIDVQVTSTILNINKLTFVSLTLSLIVGILVTVYLYIEKMCIKIVINTEHSALKEKIKICLDVDKNRKEQKEAEVLENNKKSDINSILLISEHEQKVEQEKKDKKEIVKGIIKKVMIESDNEEIAEQSKQERQEQQKQSQIKKQSKLKRSKKFQKELKS